MMRRRVVVRGVVQGVFFRASTQRQAQRRHVAGWVTNRPDGAVEAVFEGAPDDVEAMVTWAAAGPPQARVSHLEVTEEEPEGERDFQILARNS